MFGVGRGSCRKRRRKNRWVKTDGRFGGVDSVWRDEGWWMDGGHAGRLAVGGRFGAGGRRPLESDRVSTGTALSLSDTERAQGMIAVEFRKVGFAFLFFLSLRSCRS